VITGEDARAMAAGWARREPLRHGYECEPMVAEFDLGYIVWTRPSPATAAHITVDGRLFVARGAKGDQEIDHHPLVASFLRSVPAGRMVRGAERHAELIALSDALHSGGRDYQAGGMQWQSFFIRETGDPLAGLPSRPCETCVAALVEFGALPWSELGHYPDFRSTSEEIPQPGRFPDEVAAVLAAGGWLSLAGVARDDGSW
jgi:hypothetical protein